MSTTLGRAAARLIEQRLSLVPITPLGAGLSPQSIADGYAIQAALHPLLVNAGMGEMIGHKVGCTTPVMQAFVNINHPCAGRIFSRTVMRDHGVVPRHGFVKLGIECEIVVRLGRDLPPQATPYTRESVADAVEEIMPGIELVDERYQDFNALGVPTLVADDFFNAGCVLGKARRDWRSLDLGALVGRTWINHVEVARGRGADVLGHPFNSLAWLANAQHEYGLPGLKAGEFVMLGSLVQTQWLKAGDKVRIAIEALGEVTLDVTD